MITTKVYDYSMATAPLLDDLGESVPDNSSNTKKKGNKKKIGKNNNTRTRGTEVKTSNKSVLVAKTYKLPKDMIQSVERMAYWRRLKIQDVMAEALSVYIATVPKEDLKPIPSK